MLANLKVNLYIMKCTFGYAAIKPGVKRRICNLRIARMYFQSHQECGSTLGAYRLHKIVQGCLSSFWKVFSVFVISIPLLPKNKLRVLFPVLFEGIGNFQVIARFRVFLFGGAKNTPNLPNTPKTPLYNSKYNNSTVLILEGV